MHRRGTPSIGPTAFQPRHAAAYRHVGSADPRRDWLHSFHDLGSVAVAVQITAHALPPPHAADRLGARAATAGRNRLTAHVAHQPYGTARPRHRRGVYRCLVMALGALANTD